MDNLTRSEIKKLQNNLQLIRKLAGWTAADLGDKIGVTKQTIGNLENNNTEMTKTQYIAIRAVLDYEINQNKENDTLAQVVDTLLDSDNLSDEDQKKVEETMAFVSGAAERGVKKETIQKVMDAILKTLGVAAIVATGAVATKKANSYPWLKKINRGE